MIDHAASAPSRTCVDSRLTGIALPQIVGTLEHDLLPVSLAIDAYRGLSSFFEDGCRFGARTVRTGVDLLGELAGGIVGGTAGATAGNIVGAGIGDLFGGPAGAAVGSVTGGFIGDLIISHEGAVVGKVLSARAAASLGFFLRIS